jgi:hypothetical protein
MKRHEIDLVSLLFGLAFAITAAGVLAYELADADIDPAWVAAVSLIFLGVVALISTLLGRPSAAERPEGAELPERPERIDDIAEG